MTIFLCGDVMTGRGIDQVFPHPSDPRLDESYGDPPLEYVALAEKVHGHIPRPVPFSYIWGDALEQLERFAPDIRIVNLETSVTTSEAYEPKGIHYRMHPANVPCLTAAGIDCCVLANNHTLDWGPEGLVETMAVLQGAGLKTAGAGRTAIEAMQPASFPADNARLLVFAAATTDCGVLAHWAAGEGKPGIALLPEISEAAADSIAARVQAWRRPGDYVVFSIHWGGNWGYEIPRPQREFAHRLIDAGGADVIHGHSSHHPKAVEVYKRRLILYGCGDFLDDYEGISGYEEYRTNLALMYFVTLGVGAGELLRLVMAPLEIRRFRLQRARPADSEWLRDVLDRQAGPMGAKVNSPEEAHSSCNGRLTKGHLSQPIAIRSRERTHDIAGSASGANQECDIEMAARFAVEVAKAFSRDGAKFYDSEEFTRLITLYGPMKHLQRSQGS